MNEQTRNNPLMPIGLPAFVGVAGATLVLSMASILLRMDQATAPVIAIAVASAILLFCTLAAVLPSEDAWYVGLLGGIGTVALIVVGLVMASGGHHPEVAMLIGAGIILSGILSLTLLPVHRPQVMASGARSGLPVRPIIGVLALAALFVGLSIYGIIKSNQDDPATAVASATSTPSATPAASGTPGAGRVIQITMVDNAFEPAEVTAAPGESITFEIKNNGAAIHNFAIAGGPKSDIVNAGQTATVTYAMGDSDVQFVCEFHPPSMVGTIKVQ